MTNRNPYNKSASRFKYPTGMYFATVSKVDGTDVYVKVPRLTNDFEHGPIPYAGALPTVDDEIFVGFLEGSMDDVVAVFPGSDDGGGSSGPIEVTYTVASSTARQGLKDVADYVCDGVADEVEINDAIDAIAYDSSTYRRGRIVFTEGDYNLADRIRSFYTGTVNIIFQGAGQNTTWINAYEGTSTSGNGLFDLRGAYTFRDLTIYHENSDGNTPRTIWTVGSVRIYDCEIEAWTGTSEVACETVTHPILAVIENDYYYSSVVRDSNISGEGTCIKLEGNYIHIDGNFIDCYGLEDLSNPLSVSAVMIQQGSHHWVTNNYVESSGRYGIRALYGSNFITGNDVYMYEEEDVDFFGISLYGYQSIISDNVVNGGRGGIDLGSGSQITCSNNYVQSATHVGIYGQQTNIGAITGNNVDSIGGYSAFDSCMILEDCYGLTVSGNSLWNSSHGLWLSNSSEITISGNQYSGGWWGIGLMYQLDEEYFSGETDVAITGNQFSDTSRPLVIRRNPDEVGNDQTLEGLTITGNMFEATYASPETDRYCEIGEGVSNVQITGNQFGHIPLKISGVSELVFTDNHFFKGPISSSQVFPAGVNGSLVVDGCDWAHIANNTFSGPAEDAGDALIHLTGTMEYPYVHGNMYTGYGRWQYSLPSYRDYGILVDSNVTGAKIGPNDFARVDVGYANDNGIDTRFMDLVPYQLGTDQNPLATGTGNQPQPFTGSGEIVYARAVVGTAPTGASIIVNVKVNGSSLWTAQGNQPTIAASATDSDVVAPDQNASLSDGDIITVDVDQVGSTVAGGYLTVVLYVRQEG